MAEAVDGEYNNSHRAFLQAFIARSTVTFEDAKPILAAILTANDRRETLAEDITQADFNAYISAANNAISPFDLEIRGTYHQMTRSRIYSIINTTSDPITQLATVHTADEISYLKRVLDAMFETYNTPRHEVMAITSMQAIKLHKAPMEDARQTQNGSETQGSAGQSLTMGQAEKMLKSLVEEGWFEKSQKGYYSLSPRALMELRGWLFETYNDVDEEEDEEMTSKKIKQCFACKDIITTNFFRTQRTRKCPLCQSDWTGKDFVGERAAISSKPKSKKSGSGARVRPQSPGMAEEEAAENHNVGEDPDE
ncbi:hypothetical protein ACLMJK_004309 [Lecanora helva]